MKHQYRREARALMLGALLALWFPNVSGQTESNSPPPILSLQTLVVTENATEDFSSYVVVPGLRFRSVPDAAALLRQVPGADLNYNGPLTGQVQYRGLSGPRMNVRVGGMQLAPGGPNWMDPPLHYVTRFQLQSLEVIRGIAPVSSGGETLGGAVNAKIKSSTFGDSDEMVFHGETELSGFSASDGIAVGTILKLANDTHRFHIMESYEEGNDLEFADGDILDTSYERNSLALGYGLRSGAHEWEFDYRRIDTDDVGTPALPMDIIFFETDLFHLGHQFDGEQMTLSTNASYSDIDHQMNNFSHRQTPTNAFTGTVNQRFAVVEAEGFGFDMTLRAGLGDGELAVGIDGKMDEHTMDIFDPTNAGFFVNNFNNAERDRYGVFVEWTQTLEEDWGFELGVRYNRVTTDSGDVNLAAALPAPAQGLRTAFNASDRERTDDNVDVVAKVQHRLSENLSIELGAARKTRSPNYIERYAWLPIEVTSGLADGNNHIGDINLDPETSHDLELGFDWQCEHFYSRPRLFYRHIDDYIQGTPVDNTVGVVDSPEEMVSRLNGDTTPLRYSNVDAKLYGFDLDWGAAIAERCRIDGSISYVRGERRDIDDDLYRLAPLTASLAMSHVTENWQFTVEGVFADRQDRVSVTNGETETDAWAVMNLFGRWQFCPHAFISVGVGNVFDTHYEDHLSGFNRVLNSDVAVGDKMPGPGRNFFATVGFDW